MTDKCKRCMENDKHAFGIRCASCPDFDVQEDEENSEIKADLISLAP